MMQVLAGLLHVHARSLVHRDIKPDNLLVLPGMDDDGDPTELVKVCDFGIAVGGSPARVGAIGPCAASQPLVEVSGGSLGPVSPEHAGTVRSPDEGSQAALCRLAGADHVAMAAAI